MSVFLDCFKNNGYDYIRIVDGRRHRKADGKISNRRVTVKNLGLLKRYDDGQGDGLLGRLRERFREGTLEIGMPYEELPRRAEAAGPVIRKPAARLDARNIGYFVLEGLFGALGVAEVLRRAKSEGQVEYDLVGLSRLLVYGRVLDPRSKKGTYERRGRYLFDVTTSGDMQEIYRTLDVLDEESESIQRRMDARIAKSGIGRKTEVTYYDVTNYYFETMYGDEDVYETDADGKALLDEKGKPLVKEKKLRKKGVSKEKKSSPIVAMGLYMDENGIPISYNMYPGNTQDKTTFKDMIEKSVNRQGFGKVIVVADNGMNAQENMYLLVAKGNGYIISRSAKKSWTAEPEWEGTGPEGGKIRPLCEWASDGGGYACMHDDQGAVTFKSKSREYRRELSDRKGNRKTIVEKEVLFWSRAHYEREVMQHRKFIEYLESCREHPDKLKDRQRKSQDYIKVLQTDPKTGEVLRTRETVVLLEGKIAEYKATMGYYSIVTSEAGLTDREIINRYHGLSRIEDSFRVIKSDLEGRPIYVKLDGHIRAHFLVCFVALTMIRVVQHRVLAHLGRPKTGDGGWESGITAERLAEALGRFEANHIGDGYYQLSEISADLGLVLDSLGLKCDLVLPGLSQIRALKNSFASLKL